MSETNLQGLMAAIDECGDRLESAEKAERIAIRQREDIDIEHTALMRALALTQVSSPSPSAPVAKDTPAPVVEKSPREKCADLIDGLGIDLSWSPEPIAKYLATNGLDFNMRTVRAAIALAAARRQEPRTAGNSASDVHTERTDARSSGAEPPTGGVGPIEPSPIEPPTGADTDDDADSLIIRREPREAAQ